MEYFKTIDIPHLSFTVHFMDLSNVQGLPKIEHKGVGFTCTIGETDTEVLVAFKNIKTFIKEKKNAPYIAHELIHVLQLICERYQMTFKNEVEHMAYLMTYLYKKLTDEL